MLFYLHTMWAFLSFHILHSWALTSLFKFLIISNFELRGLCALSIVEVKQSHYRPGEVLRVPGGWGSQISRQSAHEGGKVVSPIHQPPLPQEIFLVLFSVRNSVNPRAIGRPEELLSTKNFSDTIRNRNCDLPACSAVPPPNAPPCAPFVYCII